MGLLFSLFSRGFFGFWPQVAQTLRKLKWSKKYRLGDYIRPNISRKSFVFLSLFGFWPKVAKPSRKPQSTQQKTKIRRLYEARHFPQIFVYCFLFFFGFLEVVATFGQKPKKHRDTQKSEKNKKNQKKNEKTKQKAKIRRIYEARHFPQMFFFVLSSFFWFLTTSSKNLEKTKYNKD